MVCGFTLLMLQHTDFLLTKQQQTAMDLEEHVRQREMDTQIGTLDQPKIVLCHTRRFAFTADCFCLFIQIV